MKFSELCQRRFSVRQFAPEALSEADVTALFEAVRNAPSACNRQPWQFLWVCSPEARQQLQQCYDRSWFAAAPTYVVCLRKTDSQWVRPEDGKGHGDIDVAIATEHLCLAAAERGIGTCWVCNFQPDALRQAFGSEVLEPVAVIAMGYPAPGLSAPEKVRRPLHEILRKC